MPVEKIIIVTLACCVLHNYYEIQHERVHSMIVEFETYVGFHVGRMQLPREGEVAKIVEMK